MKKFLAMAMAALMMVAALASCASSGDPNAIDDYTPENLTAETSTGSYTYERGEGDTVILAKYESKKTHGEEVVVPATVELEGTVRRVIGISDEAFYGLSAISKVTIAASITSIGKYAFADCIYLTEVVFEEGSQLASIGDMAFWGCTSLKAMDLSGTVVKTLGIGVFDSCTALTDMTLSDTLTTIGKAAFFGCSGLTAITLPDSVTKLNDLAFFGCTGLTTLVLSDNLSEMGEEALLLTKDTTLADKVDLEKLAEDSYARDYVNTLLYGETESETESESDTESDTESDAEAA